MLLNIYIYKITEDYAYSRFYFDFPNLCLKSQCSKPTSRRMRFLERAISKAIKDYLSNSRIKLEGKNKINSKIILSPQNFNVQCNNIMKHINDSINNDARIQATKNLLQIIELYQNQTTPADQKLISPRLGQLAIDNDKIIIPSGLSQKTEIIKKTMTSDTSRSPTKSELNKQKEGLEKDILTPYASNKSSSITLQDINLTISKLEYNKLTNMIYLRIYSNQIEVLNTFECENSTNAGGESVEEEGEGEGDGEGEE